MRVVDFDKLDGAKVLADGLQFPESPRFALGEIYFVDGPAVRAVDLRGKQRKIADVPTSLCLGLQIESDGTIYVGGSFTRQVYRIVGGKTSVAADLSSVSRSPTNELVRLPSGDLIVGTIGFDPLAGEPPAPGGLYVVSKDGKIRKTGPDIVFTNGMVLADGGRTLYLSAGGTRILRFSLEPDGEVIDWTELPLQGDPPPVADGIAQAADGSFWYGDMGSGAAVRRGEDGFPDLIINTGKKHATACWAFEANGREWLVVTATDHGPEPGLPNRKTGSVLAVPMASVIAG